MRWKWLGQYRELGLLLLRLGWGALFVYYGWRQLVAGPPQWQELGVAVHYLGIYGHELYWGLAAALGLAIGGMCLLFGFFFRPGCLLLSLVMAVALWQQGQQGHWPAARESFACLILFVGLLLVGPGRLSVDGT